MGGLSEDPEFNRLFRKQVNLYRLQELVDSLVMGAKGSHFSFSEDVIKRLHHVAMRGLLNPAGEYRVSPVTITNSPHQPPPWVDVPVHMANLCKYVEMSWQTRDMVHLSAFVMWRLNWIHPFGNGNGRTSRAASYLVLCSKHGNLLPAKKTVIQQIMENREPYYQALRLCDQGHEKTGDLSCLAPLEALLTHLLKEQIKASLQP